MSNGVFKVATTLPESVYFKSTPSPSAEGPSVRCVNFCRSSELLPQLKNKVTATAVTKFKIICLCDLLTYKLGTVTLPPIQQLKLIRCPALPALNIIVRSGAKPL